MTAARSLNAHHEPVDFSNRAACAFTRFLRFFADVFFARRYGHRIVVLETVPAVPGMVGGALQHLKCLRRLEDGHGWIRTLLDEAGNKRLLVLLAQGVFYNCFFVLYLVSPRTAHRIVGYFEEEAVISYTEYLSGVDAEIHANVPAPQIAIDYWKLPPDAKLREVILAVHADEAGHRDVNHDYANQLA